MGRDYAYPFTVKVRTNNGLWSPMGWAVRGRNGRPGDGKPTSENLRKFAEQYESSTLPGGCNAHLGATKILAAAIYAPNSPVPVAVLGNW